MKTCSKCGETRDESDYFIRDKLSGRLHAQCKECYRKHRTSYHARHYAKYGDEYRARASARRVIVKQGLQKQMLQYLSDKACEVCGENDPCVLDFDHLDPSLKSFGIARAVSDGMAWKKILTEIGKCRIVCANCHRKHTARQRGWYKLL